jgi:hypothetical protein
MPMEVLLEGRQEAEQNHCTRRRDYAAVPIESQVRGASEFHRYAT